MGQFESGKWIIGILLYFTLFYLVMLSVVAARTEIFGFSDPNVQYTDPGFQTQNQFYYTNPYCGGETDIIRGGWFINHFVLCNEDFLNSDQALCNSTPECNFLNSTDSPSGIQYCDGSLNNSVYNLSSGILFCSSPVLQNDKFSCEGFGCTWINSQAEFTQYTKSTDLKASNAQFWTITKWIVTFQVNLGLGQWNWLFFIIFFWLPLVALLWSIYMALPFAH